MENHGPKRWHIGLILLVGVHLTIAVLVLGLQLTTVSSLSSNSGQNALRNYTDVVAIPVFDVGRMVNGTEQGVCTMSFGEYFAFSPKQKFLRVNNFSCVLEAYKEGEGLRFYNLDLAINGHFIMSNHLEIIDYYPSFRTLGSDIAPEYIEPGINYVTFQFTEYLFILKMDVYIQYVYQA